MNFRCTQILLFLFGLSYLPGFGQTGETPAYKFVKNEGQWDDHILYKANLPGGALFLEDNKLTYHFIDRSDFNAGHANDTPPLPDANIRGHAYTVTFEGAAGNHDVYGSEQTTEYYNFYLGNDQEKWASEVWGYKHITYKNIYPGIDYQVYTHDLAMKYDFTLDAGTDPSIIALSYDGVDDLSVKNGELIVRTSVGEIIEQKPYAYQNIDGNQVEVACKYKLKAGIVTFKFPDGWNEHYPLVIDPTLIFASYSGSTADNFGMTATYDLDNNFFSAGMVFNTGYPTTVGAYDITSNPTGTLYGVTDVFVTRYDSTGATLIYSTYLGGGTDTNGTETAHSLIVNSNNELLIFGVTSSDDFPMMNAYDNTFNGGSMIGFYNNGAYFYTGGTDMYVTRFSEDGTALIGSTYIGGSGNDGVNYNQNIYTPPNYNSAYDSLQFNYGDTFRGEIMLDSNDDVLIASCTKSADFPVVGGFQGALNGEQDAVVFKLSGDLSSMMWSTYMGGADKDAAYSVKVDSADVVYVTGGTVSPDFPIVGATYSTSYSGGVADGYIAKISADGSTLQRSTYLGTNAYDQCFFVEVDNYAAVYVVGQTENPAAFPIVNVGYSNPNSGHFVAKFSTDLSTLVYSTQFGDGGGQVDVSPAAFLVDVCQNVYVSAWGARIVPYSPPGISGMPLTLDAVQSTTDGYDFYLIVFERDISNLLYASYFGGNQSLEHVDGGTSRFDKNGVVYQSVCAGCGGNDDFPTTPGAWSNVNLSTNCNNGTFKYDMGIIPVAQFDIDTLWGCAPFTVTLTNNSSLTNNVFEWQFGNGDSTTSVYSPTVTYLDTGTFTVTLIITDTICQISDTAVKVVTVFPELTLLVSNDTSLCVSAPIDLVATSNGSSLTYVWSTNNNFTDTLNSPITDSIFTVTPTSAGYYYCLVENPWCRIVDSVLVSFVPENIYVGDTTLCNGFGGQITLVNYYPQDTIVSYDWSPDAEIISGDGTPTITVLPTSGITYYVTVTTSSGCVYTDSSVVNVVLGGGVITAWADNDTIPIDGTTILHAEPDSSGYTYSWNIVVPPLTGATVTDPTTPNPVFKPDGAGLYTICVDITDTNGCTGQACVQIRVTEMICGEPDIYVPNAFTPNGDLQNDMVFVRGNNIEEMNFEIYDRWGELMFQTDDQTEGWDGTYKGMLADPAVFVYHLKGTCIGGDEFLIKGNITLIK